MTLKLKISLEKGTAPDFSEIKYRAERDIVRPTFTHKVSSVMQIKCEKSGILSGDYELVWDEESGDYIMRPIDNGQISLFEDREQISSECEEINMDDIDTYDYEEPDLEVAKNGQ